MHGFYSLRRDPIRLYTLKQFDESFGSAVHERINALHPGYYTRVGAAIRAVSKRLQQRPTRQKLLLLLSDGKPNDMDHYEGRFGVEDTRHAVMQARQQGITPFCITIDEKASIYLPYMFGQQNFVVVRKPEQLPQALLQVYRLLTR
jgi:nitric oxide reductase NorD protein